MTDLISRYVDNADFTGLFVEELGWNRPTGRTLTVEVDGASHVLTEAATLKGITVWACPGVPDGRTQREIDRHAKKESTERLLIFHDTDRQQWKWPQTRDSSGAGAARLVTHDHHVGRGNTALSQRLKMIEFGLDDDPTVVEVNRRLRRAFDADKITKKFYKKFASHHDLLCDAIDITDAGRDPAAASQIRWYGSLLMNRLMFIYFMQRKGFLDNDTDYLRNRLLRLQEMTRPGSFYEFYRDFLIPLFHDGLGAAEGARHIDDPDISALVGDVPYVNGGIFSEHHIEAAYDIRVPDDVFVTVFDFFDSWQWHLDDRPTGNPNEINPDVLGYIFEQFVNNKQQGAYYTKEDVTGYMTTNTLVPVFLERLEQATGINPWLTLAKRPDRYIWDGVQHGLDLPLPDFIVAEQDVWPRPAWDNTEPDETLALPGETWWEAVDRRRHAETLRDQITSGHVASADAAVTANLDLELLAVDCIDAIDNPDDVAAAWRTLTALKVVDPTCGSGAFLFAALNVLHDLYSTVLDVAASHARTKPTVSLHGILSTAAEHHSRDYYILKHAALNNLYGVDIMPEAVEIARLRLFLKLISQIDRREDIEPLPDLEFNIRPGNILVGALDEPAIRDKADLTNLNTVDTLVSQAAEASGVYRLFAEAQESGDDDAVDAARSELSAVTAEVRTTLDEWWHQAQQTKQTLDRYLDVHRPFHWFIEFPEVFSQGGFDVVIGNPPYIRKSKVPYTYRGFASDDAPDIYAPCLERASQIASGDGRLAMIVPLSLSFSDQFKSTRSVVTRKFGSCWSATFGKRPSSLFAGVQVRCTIVLGSGGSQGQFTTTHNIWVDKRRPTLMPGLRYANLPQELARERWYKVGDPALVALLLRFRQEQPVALLERKTSEHKLWWKPVGGYWMPVWFDCPPTYGPDGSSIEPNVRALSLDTEEDRDIVVTAMAGKLGYLWWSVNGDDLNIPPWIVRSFPAFHREHPELPERLYTVIQRFKERLQQPDALLWNKNAGQWVGSYDVSRATDILDESDRVIVSMLLDARAWESVEVWYRRVMQSTGEPTGSHRGPSPPS